MMNLDEIKARANAATEGPWDYYRAHYASGYHTIYQKHEMGDFDVATEASKSDAEFIAHAREDIPALVAEVERLRRKVLSLESEIQYLTVEEAVK